MSKKPHSVKPKSINPNNNLKISATKIKDVKPFKTALTQGLKSRNETVRKQAEDLYKSIYTKKGTVRKRINKEAVNEQITALKQKQQEIKQQRKVEKKRFETGKSHGTWDNKSTYNTAVEFFKKLALEELPFQLSSEQVVELANEYVGEEKSFDQVINYLKEKIENDTPSIFKSQLKYDDSYNIVNLGIYLMQNGINLNSISEELLLDLSNMPFNPNKRELELIKKYNPQNISELEEILSKE